MQISLCVKGIPEVTADNRGNSIMMASMGRSVFSGRPFLCAMREFRSVEQQCRETKNQAPPCPNHIVILTQHATTSGDS